MTMMKINSEKSINAKISQESSFTSEILADALSDALPQILAGQRPENSPSFLCGERGDGGNNGVERDRERRGPEERRDSRLPKPARLEETAPSSVRPSATVHLFRQWNWISSQVAFHSSNGPAGSLTQNHRVQGKEGG